MLPLKEPAPVKKAASIRAVTMPRVGGETHTHVQSELHSF